MVRLVLLASVLVMFTGPLVENVLAHGGGLDAYGCHRDRKRGGYHCHRGPLAGHAFASKEEMLRALQQQRQAAPISRPPEPRTPLPAPKR